MPAVSLILTRLLLLLGPIFCLMQCASPGTPKRRAAMTMDLEAGRWAGRDGRDMPFTRWKGDAAPLRGVVICIHGLSGAASDFWPVGEALPPQGFAVYGMQLRGQGNDPDPSRRGDIRSGQEWLNDLTDFTALVKQRHRGLPVYWYGESLGALIAIHTAAESDPRLEPAGIILSSPVVRLRDNLKLGFFKNMLVRATLNLLPGKKISLERLGNAEVQVTSHTTHREQMQHTAHYVPAFTLRLFAEIEKLIQGSGTAAQRIKVPVLVLYTPHDPLVSKEGVEKFFDQLDTPWKRKEFFPTSYHLILHDDERPRALKVITQWLKARGRE
ncbi:MAG: alpha/beta fold hydrolase [Verrucomicrobiota bacterium]